MARVFYGILVGVCIVMIDVLFLIDQTAAQLKICSRLCPQTTRCVVKDDKESCTSTENPGNCPPVASNSTRIIQCNDDADCLSFRKCCPLSVSRSHNLICSDPADDDEEELQPKVTTQPPVDANVTVTTNSLATNVTTSTSAPPVIPQKFRHFSLF